MDVGGLMTIQGPVPGLLIERLIGSEYLSRLFRFQLWLLAPKGESGPVSKWLGQSVTVSLPIPGGGTRYFNGILAQIVEGPPVSTPKGDFIRCRAILVPKLWELTRRKRCWAYQSKEMTAPNLITSLLGGIYWSSSIAGSFPTLQYSVQYRETNFSFISRVMEREGIFYYFLPSDGNHQMMLGNTASAHQPVSGPSSVSFARSLGGVAGESGQITAWELRQQPAPSCYQLWDYNFEASNQGLAGKSSLPDKITVGTRELPLNLAFCNSLTMFDYPGYYAWQYDNVEPDGQSSPNKDFVRDLETAAQNYTQLWMQRAAVASLRVRGVSTCPQFVAGCTFEVDPSGGDWEGTYVLTAVKHFADQTPDGSGKFPSSCNYSNEFRCIPSDPNLPYVPPLRTPRPVVRSVQTAVVVGVSQNDITTEVNGRVKVQFFWNQMGANNLESQSGQVPANLQYWPGTGSYTPTNSCWIRVAQTWAGRSWGSIILPRLGDEVVVAFLEGDPDQPLIVGSVYNSVNRTPFPMPGSAGTSGIKSYTPDSVSSDLPAGKFNGLAFVDNKDGQNAQLYAARNLILSSNADTVHNVAGDLYQNIGGKTKRLTGNLPKFGTTQNPTGVSETKQPVNAWLSWVAGPASYADVTGGLGADLQYIYGEYTKAVIGLYNTFALGSKFDLIVDPMAFRPLKWLEAIPVLGSVLAGLSGKKELVLGSKTEFNSGLKATIIMKPKKDIEIKQSLETQDPPRIPVGTTAFFELAVPALAALTTLEFVTVGAATPFITQKYGGDKYSKYVKWGLSALEITGASAVVFLAIMVLYKAQKAVEMYTVPASAAPAVNAANNNTNPAQVPAGPGPNAPSLDALEIVANRAASLATRRFAAMVLAELEDISPSSSSSSSSMS